MHDPKKMTLLLAELRDARALVRDLRAPRRSIYWADLLATSAMAWAAVVAATLAPAWMGPLAVLVGSMAFCRGAILLHELVHLREGAVPGLRLGWNVLLGVPFLLPSFVYERLHRDHHRALVYRTPADPEHAPDDTPLGARLLVTLATTALLPLGLVVRWLVLAPASLFDPRLRRLVDERASSLCGNPAYRPAPLSGRERRAAIAAEVATSAWTAALAFAATSGRLPPRTIIAMAAIVAVGVAISSARGELLHRFGDREARAGIAGQVLDSRNVPVTGLVSSLLLPARIGYHALHHLDARLPYHALPEAHARLLARLPAGSFYHRVTRAGIMAAAREALADARG
jgi:fatty acid desaturase